MGRKEELGQKIAQTVSHWKYLRDNGGSDPFWPDGVNMNLTRNHVEYYKRLCESELAPEDFPPEYQLETPPCVDNGYMACPDRIRSDARKSLKILEKDPDYQWLREQAGAMSAKEIKETAIKDVINYIPALRQYIQEDRLVDMRRFGNADTIRKSFRYCRKRVEEIRGAEKELPVGQLTLFDLGM